MKIAVIIGTFVLVSSVFGDDICPSFFKNDSCTVRVCLNGGYLSDTGICICPSGYLGIHCEAVKTSLPPDNHFKAGGSSFNIININLYTRYWGQKTYYNIKQSISNHVRDYAYDTQNLLETSGSAYLDTFDEPHFEGITFNQSFNNSIDLSSFNDAGIYWCYELPIYKKLINMTKTASLKNTVITIISQHPPAADQMEEAREIAVALNIRINVLWISDVTFNDCTDKQINDFKAFVDITGGLFVQLQSEMHDVATINLVSQVLLTHYKPQYVSIQSFDDCSSFQSVSVVIDPLVSGPYNFVFLGKNASPSPDSYRDCLLRPPLRSYDSELAFFQSPDPTCSTVSIKSDSGSCTSIVFTNADSTSGPLDLAIYTTYVEDRTIDASRYAIVETVPFYPAFHVESSDPLSSITVNSVVASFDKSWNPTLEKRSPAAFEWSPNKTITCDAAKTYSLFLNITVNSATVQRAVRVACVPVPSIPVGTSTIATSSATSSIVLASSTSLPSTSTVFASTTEGSSSSSTAPCNPTDNYSTFLFAYATDFSLTSYNLARFTISGAVTSTFPTGQVLANVPFDMETPMNIVYSTSVMNFTNSLVTNTANASLAADGLASSGALKIIRNFLTDTSYHKLDESTLLVFVNRLPKIEDDLTDNEYNKLTNSNVKIFPMMSVNDVSNNLYSGRSLAVFNRLAAQTNGHFIVANDALSKGNSDFNMIVSSIMQTSYRQNLLFTRNVGAGREGTNLGTVRIPASSSSGNTVSVTITATLSILDQVVPQLPNRLLLGIKPNSLTSKSISIDFLNSPNVTRYTNSNFFITTVDLDAGIARELFLQYVPGSENSDLLIRMWISNNVYRDADFVSLGGTKLDTVTENTGAALRVKLDKCSSKNKGTLLITNCNGVVSSKYDSDQTFDWTNSSSFYQFIPFFCDSTSATATCINGAESKYDAQFVSDTFSMTRSFQCRPGSGPTSNCQLKDSNGNYQCSGASPFRRGPDGSLTDCSNNGHLVYNGTAFNCQCDSDKFTGSSCEVVSCAEADKNNDPLAIDNFYHTYTVVLDVSAGAVPVFDDAKKLFGLGSTSDFSKIWKYQLLVVCADNVFEMVYSGSDILLFKKSFGNYVTCNPATTTIDLTTVYNQAVKGIGRNVKGVIVYYSEISKILNVTLDEFVTASQAYQQQLFVFGIDEIAQNLLVLMNESIAHAAMSTGGFLIQSFVDDNFNVVIDETFIPSLLSSSSSIAWYSSDQTDTFSYTATSSYFLTWKAGQQFETGSGLLPPDCKYAGDIMAFCQLDGPTRINSNGSSYYVAVYALNDVAPKAQIISDLSKDTSNAISTSSSDTRTILSVYVPDEYSIVGNYGDGGVTRNAKRNGCTFGWTAYSVFASQKYEKGANIAKITLQNDANPSSSYTRFFAFGTSSAPACKNGGTPLVSTGSCSCPSGFQGPDCSLVNCLENSISNAWSDVCVCNKIDDVACANHLVSII